MSIIRDNKIATILCIAAALLVSAHPTLAQTHADHEPHWSYSGADGPDHWGDLSPISPPAKPASINPRSISWTPRQPPSPPSISITNSPR